MTTEEATKHLGERDFEFSQRHQSWFPPYQRVVTREDWEAVKVLHDHYGTGLFGDFAFVGHC